MFFHKIEKNHVARKIAAKFRVKIEKIKLRCCNLCLRSTTSCSIFFDSELLARGHRIAKKKSQSLKIKRSTIFSRKSKKIAFQDESPQKFESKLKKIEFISPKSRVIRAIKFLREPGDVARSRRLGNRQQPSKTLCHFINRS